MIILHGDCLAAMPTLDAESVDAIVCDPPYGLSFMGKAWDHGVPGVPFWEAALRVAKPGAHLVAFGGTRTYHRLTVAIEDAGWEIRDCLSWLYGSGFPKSLDVSKAMDKAAGVDRDNKFGGAFERRAGPTGNKKCDTCGKWLVSGSPCQCPRPQDAPQTDLAKQWQGWGTALKPAWEPIILARKPLVGTVASNVTAHGTGALNIDGCRLEGPKGNGVWGTSNKTVRPDRMFNASPDGEEYRSAPHGAGRWPANVCLDEDAAAVLDAQTGTLSNGFRTNPSTPNVEDAVTFKLGATRGERGHNDTGGASRFFYTAKASRTERDSGLTGKKKPLLWSAGAQNPGAFQSENTDRSARNNHPTVKPLALMRWLCKLVTPAGGLILDPFTGSGSTGCAAVLEGFGFLGIEQNEEYVSIARARIAHAASQYEPTLFADGAA